MVSTDHAVAERLAPLRDPKTRIDLILAGLVTGFTVDHTPSYEPRGCQRGISASWFPYRLVRSMRLALKKNRFCQTTAKDHRHAI